MTRRKVLFLIESLAGGGAEKVLTTLVQHIDKEKFDVTVCTISGGGKYEGVVRGSVRYKAILEPPSGDSPIANYFYQIKHHLVYRWLPLSWVYRWFIPQNNDIEIAYVEGFATKLLSHSNNKKSKKYAWVHIDLFHNHWTRSIYRSLQEEVEAYRQFHTIVGVSKTVVDAFRQEFPKVRIPTTVIYNPIDSLSILSLAQESIECSAGKGIRLVTIGRLERQKAYSRLLRIVNQLHKDGFKLELWVLGDGTEKKMLGEYIRENHLENVVTLLGFQTNPYKYLIRGDLFVCSSLAEGYSTAVTEALILGLPVITTDCSGMAELLQNGECGVITENDEAALYEGLKRLLADKSLLEHYRHKAIERGKEFSIEHLMKPIETILMV